MTVLLGPKARRLLLRYARLAFLVFASNRIAPVNSMSIAIALNSTEALLCFQDSKAIRRYTI